MIFFPIILYTKVSCTLIFAPHPILVRMSLAIIPGFRRWRFPAHFLGDPSWHLRVQAPRGSSSPEQLRITAMPFLSFRSDRIT